MSKTVKTDPSVRPEETEAKMSQIGVVPISRTMQKPEAYKPAKEGPK